MLCLSEKHEEILFEIHKLRCKGEDLPQRAILVKKKFNVIWRVLLNPFIKDVSVTLKLYFLTFLSQPNQGFVNVRPPPSSQTSFRTLLSFMNGT